MVIYTARDWYWAVASSQTQVWSSARAGYVPVTDATYTAWLEAGGVATAIDSETSLQQVLAAQYPAGWPGGDLPDHLASGVVITSETTPALNGTYAVSDTARSNYTALETSLNGGKGFPPGGATTVGLLDVSGVPHVWGETDFGNFAVFVRDYFYGCVTAAAIASATKAPPSYPSNAFTLP